MSIHRSSGAVGVNTTGWTQKKCVGVYEGTTHKDATQRVFVGVKYTYTYFFAICFIPSSLASNPSEVHWLTLCTWYVPHSRSFTHESNTCKIRRLVFLNLGFIELLSCTLFTDSLLSHHLLVGCTTPESSCRRNVTITARIWQYCRPIAPIIECETSSLDRLSSRWFHSLSAHFWVTNGFFEGPIFEHFRLDELNGLNP